MRINTGPATSRGTPTSRGTFDCIGRVQRRLGLRTIKPRAGGKRHPNKGGGEGGKSAAAVVEEGSGGFYVYSIPSDCRLYFNNCHPGQKQQKLTFCVTQVRINSTPRAPPESIDR